MATEVELKARVSNPDELRGKLYNYAVYTRSFEKNDTYFCPVNNNGNKETHVYGIRLRNESFILSNGTIQQKNLVTCKSKKIAEGIEINDEREFEVSSAKAFEEFILHLGQKERNRKRKTGASFFYNGMTVELTFVESLGWFIELEIIISAKDDQTINREKEKLLDFLDFLGISRKLIESRSYSEMLIDKC